MQFKVVLYETEEGFTVFCPTLHGCITEGDTEAEALENIQSAIREYLEAVWMMTKENIAKDVAEDGILNVTFGDVEVDTEGVEDAKPEEIGAAT